MKVNHQSSPSSELNPMDKLLAKLSEQQAVMNRQHEALKTSDDIAYTRTVDYIVATSGSVPITPATEAFNISTAPTTNTPSISGEDKSAGKEDVERLRAELDAANSRIARMDQELAQSRITKHTLDQAIGAQSEAEFSLSGHSEERLNIPLPPLSSNAMRPSFQRDPSWATQDDRSDTSEPLSASGFNRSRSIWGNGAAKPAFGSFPAPSYQQPADNVANAQWMNRGYGQPFVEAPMQFSAPPPLAAFRTSVAPERMMHEPELLMAPPGRPRVGGHLNNRSRSSFPYTSSNSSFDGYTPVSGFSSGVGNPGSVGPSMYNNINMGGSIGPGMYEGYQPQPIGTPLSPHAPEFTVGPGWKNDVSLLAAFSFFLGGNLLIPTGCCNRRSDLSPNN